MNELINKDNEWIIHFMGSLDRLLDQGRRIKMRCPVKVLTGIFHPILLSAF